MKDWQTDNENLMTASEVTPSSNGNEYCSRASSSRSSWSKRRSVTPPIRGPSYASMTTDRNDKRSSRDITNDESISILDPRRFTPTLHANLVSEILALRRDQDEKTRQIESLETAVHSAKEEHDWLQENLTNASKESRSLKKQLSLLEAGSSSALGELARERDEAVDSIMDAKKRLDAAQKTIRSQQDELQRIQDLWAQDKGDWMNERRTFERKLHVAESRLKMVLDEFATFQASSANGRINTTSNEHDIDGMDSEAENDAASVRTMSMSNSVRLSLLNGPILQPGNSLADELSFEDDDQTDADGRGSVLSSPTSPKHTRSSSRDSTFGRFRLRSQSVESMSRPGSVARSRLYMIPAVLEALEGEDEDEDAAENSPAVKSCYTDTGVQYSPPPSPKILPRSKTTSPELSSHRLKTPESESPARADCEVEANQRRKRVQLNQPLVVEPPKPAHKMISSFAQTVEMPASPPRTPHTPLPETDIPESALTPMVTASTQTAEPVLASAGPGMSMLRAPLSLPPLEIPTINIQPPTSCPNTPREPRLPQHFKHFGCQVNLSSSVSTSHVSVQTEGIQVDKRMALLPVHLHPSNISSRPGSPTPSKAGLHQETVLPGSIPLRNPKRLELAHSNEMSDFASSPLASQEDGDSFLGLAHDQSPLSNKRASKRTNRFSSMFAGFDTASSDEDDGFADADMSDSEYLTALSAPKPQSTCTQAAKPGSSGTAAFNAEHTQARLATGADADADTIEDCNKSASADGLNSLHIADQENCPKGHDRKQSGSYEKAQVQAPPPSGTNTANRTGAMRKAAMIQSGLASHQQARCRSPDLSDGKSPPFPIPTRASSRRSQTDLNTPSDGRESPTRGDMWHRRESNRFFNQSPSIRKVRSAAVLPRGPRFRRHGSRSPPPLSPSTEETPESPGLPPLPRNDITTPRTGRKGGQPSYLGHHHDLSINTNYTTNTHNTVLTTDSSASQTVGVVEAIAQAMVGEWMLKYVRRRKSFNVAENTGKDDSSNDRHKRWVWLAPYERSILWSSKQPSSGSALLGKSGRKLTIQSVLDVKDDNSAPKVMPTVFNRSILILTPQRALKFTTSSADRHYVWLTALSFLAHSSQALPENIPAPLPPKAIQQQQSPIGFAPPPRRVKRGGIRDSIRLAKGKSSMSKVGTSNMSSVPSVPSSSSRRNEATGCCAADASSAMSGGHSREQSRDAAEPPFVPRFSERGANVVATHGRKRSNTGGHIAPPLSYRGFSGPAGTVDGLQHSGRSICNDSVDTAMSSDVCQTHGSTNTTWHMSQTVSERTSDTSLRPGNFFDAIGTVRMEAFISPIAQLQNDSEPPSMGVRPDYRRSVRRRRSKEIRRRNSRSRHREAFSHSRNHSRNARAREGYYKKGKHQVEEDFFVRDDPFEGF